jgi:hypothetical protein
MKTMTNDKPAIRMQLTIVNIISRARVVGKPYERMEFTAKTDKTEDRDLTFVTFSPPIMDAVYIGNSFPADVTIETKESKTESIIYKAYLPDPRETAENTRTAIMTVSDMICSKVEVPKDIIDDHYKLIEKCQKEGLK